MGFSQIQRTAPKHPKGITNHTATSARTEASIVDEGRIFAIRSKRQQAKCRVKVKQTSHDRQSSKDGTGKFVVLFRDSASSSVGLTRTQAPTLDALTAVLFPIFLKGYDNNCRIMYIMRINCEPYGGGVRLEFMAGLASLQLKHQSIDAGFGVGWADCRQCFVVRLQPKMGQNGPSRPDALNPLKSLLEVRMALMWRLA